MNEEHLLEEIAKKKRELELLEEDLRFVQAYKAEQERLARLRKTKPLGVDMRLFQDDGK